MLDTTDVLEQIKMRLGLQDTTQDVLLTSYALEIGLRILHYCNISEMPEGLLFVWAAMTIDLLRAMEGSNENIFGENAVSETDGVQQVKLGDTSVSMGSSTSTVASKTGGGTPAELIAEVVKNYYLDLVKYRRVAF